MIIRICGASGIGNAAAPWATAPLDPKVSQEQLVNPGVGYASLDAKLCDALRSVLSGDLKRRVALMMKQALLE